MFTYIWDIIFTWAVSEESVFAQARVYFNYSIAQCVVLSGVK